MMTQERDYEDALRRALAAAAESIEPAGDGLQRIRHRLDSRRSPRSVFSRCAEWLDLQGTRFLVRLDPVIDGGRAALRRAGPLPGPLAAVASFLAGLFAPRGRRRAGGHRGQASPPGRLGPAGAWLKPIFAVSAAVVIVVVGVVILNHETGTLINPANGSYGSASPGSSLGSGGKTANSRRWKFPMGVFPTQPFTGPGPHKSLTTVLPAVACTSAPAPTASAAAPTGTASASPTPTATGTATDTPSTPQPTDSGVASPTPTASAATGSTATATNTALVIHYDARARAVECASPKPSQTP
jgi:hypothetical protein